MDGTGRIFVGDLGFDLLGPRTPRCGRVIRVDPDGRAEVVAEGLDYPNGLAVSAVACALGGPDRRTLFCVSAHTTAAELRSGRSRSRLDAVPVEVGGAGHP